MKESKIYEFYAFGYNYGLLRRRDGTRTTKRIISDLNDLHFQLEHLNLPVTRKVAVGLQLVQNSLTTEADEPIGEEKWNAIKAELQKIDPCLDAELKLKTAYLLSDKRYAIESLMKKCGSLLGSGVYDLLPLPTKQDFASACRLIALNEGTGAAFHLMRALEAEVRVLYLSFKKTNRLKNPMWGPMITELRAKKKPKPSEKLLAHLDNMRNHFRNPTQHPDAFYSIDQAQDLLNSTAVAINMVRAEIPKK
jgi:hypothetical protein